jgi:hypothetical protein
MQGAMVRASRYRTLPGRGMSSVAIGLTAFLAIFSGAMIGLVAARWLPPTHLSSETRTAVSVSMAVVGTLSALVIGLLISTANASFLARSSAIGDLSVDILRLNRSLIRYGTEADPIRATLRVYADVKTAELAIWRPSDGIALETLQLLETVGDQILDLRPADERQQRIQAQAIRFAEAISDARWMLIEKGDNAVPAPFLALLIFWLAILFASFGLFAPANATTLVALLLCSLAISGGVFMILELATPTEGLVQPSLAPLRAVIVELGQV